VDDQRRIRKEKEMNSKSEILLNKTVSAVSDKCPTATTDIEENVKNRDLDYSKLWLWSPQS